MNRQPPLPELFLSGLIVDSASRDAILGDLHEEWTTRTTRDGTMAARLWYWGQALRSTPHLIWAWCKGATWNEIGVTTATSIGVAYLMLLVVFGSLGMTMRILVPMNQAMFWFQTLSITAIAGILAGAGIAAAIRRAPILTVLSTVASVAAFALMYSVVLPHYAGSPGIYLPLYFTVQSTVAAAALSAGGLRALTERQRKSAIQSTSHAIQL